MEIALSTSQARFTVIDFQVINSVCYNGQSGNCFFSHPQVTLAVLLVYSIASLAVNAFLFLYKERHKVFAIYALVPSVAAVYPLCVAAWVTKQYSW